MDLIEIGGLEKDAIRQPDTLTNTIPPVPAAVPAPHLSGLETGEEGARIFSRARYWLIEIGPSGQ